MDKLYNNLNEKQKKNNKINCDQHTATLYRTQRRVFYNITVGRYLQIRNCKYFKIVIFSLALDDVEYFKLYYCK